MDAARFEVFTLPLLKMIQVFTDVMMYV